MLYIGNEKITPGLFTQGTSSGDEVTAINYTGTSVSIGDKVWLSKKANVSASSENIQTSNTSYYYILNNDGTKVYYGQSYNNDGKIYDTELKTTSNTSLRIYYGSENYIVRYDNNGIFCGKYNFPYGDINMVSAQDNYAYGVNMLTSDSKTSFQFYKYDENFEITHTWTVSSINAYGNYFATVIGNKIYVSRYVYNYKGTIDENSNTVTLSNESIGRGIIYSTSDNKIAIGTSGFSSGYTGINLYTVDDNYNIVSQFITSNVDLNKFASMNDLYIIYNRVTDILCVSSRSTTSYGIFKYENGDFTTINVNLVDTTGTSKYGYNTLTINNDLSLVQYANKLYRLEQVEDGTYKSMPYSYGMGQQTLTGIAKTSANNGESFTAMTILPK